MWYSTALLFERRHLGRDRPSDEPLFEESIRIFQADSENDAKIAAETLGRQSHLDYTAASGETVKWHFVSVLDVYEILDAEIIDGTEVFSRFLTEPPNVPDS
jgi:hypothetical protein